MPASPIPGDRVLDRTDLDRSVITRRTLGLGVGAGAVLGTGPAAATVLTTSTGGRTRSPGDPYPAGHDIAIAGHRANGDKIADPDEPIRSGVWYTEDQTVAWNKLNRFTAFS